MSYTGLFGLIWYYCIYPLINIYNHLSLYFTVFSWQTSKSPCLFRESGIVIITPQVLVFFTVRINDYYTNSHILAQTHTKSGQSHGGSHFTHWPIGLCPQRLHVHAEERQHWQQASPLHLISIWAYDLWQKLIFLFQAPWFHNLRKTIKVNLNIQISMCSYIKETHNDKGYF